MPSVESKTTIAAPPLRALRALRSDLAQLADHVGDIDRVEVLESGSDQTLCRWSGRVTTPFGAPLQFQWTEREVWDEAAVTCTFAQTEGDFDQYGGSWTFAPSGEGCELTLGIEFSKDVGGLGAIVENLLKGKVQELADALVQAAKHLAEATETT
jgi:ribosome-associated toxin RatA of RatAB toxin-antitoxin module